MTAEVGVKMVSTTETQTLTLEVVATGVLEENAPTESSQSATPVLPTTSDSSDSKDNAPSESSQSVTPVLPTTSGISPDGEDKKEITTSPDHNAKTADEGGKKGKPVEKEKKPRKYNGNDPEMKYTTRKLLAMSTSDFGEAGEKQLLRTHILDLRCPESEQTVELAEPNMPEAKFDAIRINSWSIFKPLLKLGFLAEVNKSNVPYVFWKPFVFFVQNLEYFEDHLGELLAQRQVALEKSVTSLTSKNESSLDIINGENSHQADSTTVTGSTGIDIGTTHEPDDELEINDLRFFIRFVKENLREDLEKQRKFQSGEVTEVAFDDLHNLFRLLPSASVAGYFDGVLRAYQVTGVCGGGKDVLKLPELPNAEKRNTEQTTSKKPFEIYLFYLDFDGNHFSAIHEMIDIRDYDGVLPIRSLRVFPVNFLSPKERKTLDDRGGKFLEYALGQADGRGLHKYCAGVSLNVIRGSKDQVDSPVILDHAFALQQNPEWVVLKSKYDIGETPNMRCLWVRSGNSRYSSMQNNYHGIAGSWADIRNKRFFLDQCMRIREQCSGSIWDAAEAVKPIKHITHIRALAFVLRNRTWVSVNIDDVGDIPMQKEGFDSLVLPEGHKELVKALVQMHSQNPKTSAPATEQKFQLDLVRGKGKGLIVLLHGAPGVGKTSTAECVAEYAEKPLFPITCGDIGYEPQDVARNLEDNFRLAHRWDCVLLLDEADVFLARRDRTDLKRNSLVSVFLRVLEYYSGILFLTTNRVGTFDEAFKSRIHMSLYYPELGKKAYLKIWEMNLRRIQHLRPGIKVEEKAVMSYAKKKYTELEWNGRQIRNAVQTALALAEFRSKNPEDAPEYDVPSPPVIGKQDFKKVINASKEFEEYLKDIYGNTEADRAHHDMLRADRAHHPPAPTKSKSGALFNNDSSSSDEDSSSNELSSDSSDAKAKKDKGKAKGKGKSKKKKEKKKTKAKKQKSSESDDSSSSE